MLNARHENLELEEKYISKSKGTPKGSPTFLSEQASNHPVETKNSFHNSNSGGNHISHSSFRSDKPKKKRTKGGLGYSQSNKLDFLSVKRNRSRDNQTNTKQSTIRNKLNCSKNTQDMTIEKSFNSPTNQEFHLSKEKDREFQICSQELLIPPQSAEFSSKNNKAFENLFTISSRVGSAVKTNEHKTLHCGSMKPLNLNSNLLNISFINTNKEEDEGYGLRLNLESQLGYSSNQCISNTSISRNCRFSDKSIKKFFQPRESFNYYNHSNYKGDNTNSVFDLDIRLSDTLKELNSCREKNDDLACRLKDLDEKLKTKTDENFILAEQIYKCREALIKSIRKEEQYKKRERREWINSKNMKLCRPAQKYISGSFLDGWEDGEEVLEIKKQLIELYKSKELIERSKRELEEKYQEFTSKVKSESEKPWNPQVLDSKFFNPQTIRDIEFHDDKDLLNYQADNCIKKEMELRAKLETLEKEKIFFVSELKRLNEEESCRYNSLYKDKWPVLSDRYLLLSLLGRGGYSEVYRVRINKIGL